MTLISSGDPGDWYWIINSGKLLKKDVELFEGINAKVTHSAEYVERLPIEGGGP